MEEHSRLGALASRTPDVDTLDCASSGRSSGRYELGLAGERALQIAKELEVVVVAVVSSEPRLCIISGLVSFRFIHQEIWPKRDWS